MFCTKCGSKMPDGTVFCTSCGQKLQNSTVDAKVSAKYSAPAEQNNASPNTAASAGAFGKAPAKKKPKSKKTLVIGITAGVLGVFVVVTAIAAGIVFGGGMDLPTWGTPGGTGTTGTNAGTTADGTADVGIADSNTDGLALMNQVHEKFIDKVSAEDYITLEELAVYLAEDAGIDYPLPMKYFKTTLDAHEWGVGAYFPSGYFPLSSVYSYDLGNLTFIFELEFPFPADEIVESFKWQMFNGEYNDCLERTDTVGNYVIFSLFPEDMSTPETEGLSVAQFLNKKIKDKYEKEPGIDVMELGYYIEQFRGFVVPGGTQYLATWDFPSSYWGGSLYFEDDTFRGFQIHGLYTPYMVFIMEVAPWANCESFERYLENYFYDSYSDFSYGIWGAQPIEVVTDHVGDYVIYIAAPENFDNYAYLDE